MPSTEPGSSNRIFWVVLGSLAVILLAVVVTVIAVTVNSNNLTPENPGEQSDNLNLLSVTAPAILNVDVSVSGTKYLFNTEVEQYDQNQYKLEYSVENQNRKPVSSDVTTGTTFTASFPVSDSLYYRVKVRLVGDDSRTSEWSEAYSVTVDGSGVGVGADPDPAYFDTGWAKGEPGLNGLVEAVEIGYGAVFADETVNPIDPTYCVMLNKGKVEPGLMLPPVPSAHPADIELWFTVTDWVDSNSSGVLTYWWC